MPTLVNTPARSAPGLKTLRAMMALGTAVSLGACTSVPGVWPLSEVPAPVPGYPTVAGVVAKCDDTNGKILGGDRTDPKVQLYCIQVYAAHVAKHFADEQRTLEKIQNGETLGLFGLGTAAGVMGVVDKSSVPVRNIGLAAAALTGLGSSLGLSGQRTAYETAATGMACVIRTDAALDSAKAGMDKGTGTGTDSTASHPEDKPTTMAAMVAAANTASSETEEAGSRVFAAVLSDASKNPDNTPNDTSAIGVQSAADAINAARDAAAADSTLVAATATAMDEGNRAKTLQEAVAGVEKALADSLSKNVDVMSIYNATKSGFTKMANGVPAASMAAKAAQIKTQAHPAAKLMPMMKAVAAHNLAMVKAHKMSPNSMSAEMKTDDVSKLTQAGTSAGMHADATKAVTDAVVGCGGDPNAKPSQTAPGSSPAG